MIAKFFQLFMAKDRVVVEVDLAVERRELAVLCGDEGIDLHQQAVGLEERLVHAHHEAHGLGDLRTFEAELERQPACLVCGEADRGIDHLLEDRVGILVRDLLDLHTAGLRGHKHDLAAGPVKHDAEV